MILANESSQDGSYAITDSNGRSQTYAVGGLSKQDVDLSKYLPPFKVQVTLGGNTGELVEPVDGGATVSAQLKGNQVITTVS